MLSPLRRRYADDAARHFMLHFRHAALYYAMLLIRHLLFRLFFRFIHYFTFIIRILPPPLPRYVSSCRCASCRYAMLFSRYFAAMPMQR